MNTIASRILLFIALSVMAVAPESTTLGQTPAPQKPAAAPAAQNSGAAPAGDPEGWPKEIKSGETFFKVHQPQFDSWEGGKLEAYAAVEVTTSGSDKPFYGAALLAARTSVDKENRMVTLEDIQVAKALSPSAKDNEGLYLRILQNSVVQKVRQISLDRFEAGLAIMEAGHATKALPLKNDPPRIGDDIYAGKDGTVYRKGQNGWEQNSGSGWNQVQRPDSTGQQGAESLRNRAQAQQAPATRPQQSVNRAQPSTMQQGRVGSAGQLSSQDTLRSLERHQAARSTGQMRTQGYRSGAYRGGGGFRRR